MKNLKFAITPILIIALILVVNLISDDLYLRLDLTGDKQYTLSQATKNILKELDEPVTVSCYFSENLPPNIALTRRDFKDLLQEYSRKSDGMLVYEFLDPNKSEEIERKAQQKGISPILIDVREKDEMKQQKAYMGAVISKGKQTDIIPFIQPGAAMEFGLSTAIKRVSTPEKQTIALIQGHGEATESSLGQLSQAASVTYAFETFTLTDTTPIPSRFNTAAIISPTDSFSVSQINHLDNFISNGGKLFLALNTVNGNLQNAIGEQVSTGLDAWLASKNIEVAPEFIVDKNCGSVTVTQQQGFLTFQTPVQFPYLPLFVNFANHPISKGLEQCFMQFASPVRVTDTSNFKSVELVFSSEKSTTQTLPVFFDISKQWTDNDFDDKNIPVAVAIEGKVNKNGKNTRMVIIGDGDFIKAEGRQQLQPDNINLAINSLDWLADETGLIELRTKGIQSRPIRKLDDGTRAFYKYLNFALPIALVLAYGFIRNRKNIATRNKRMEENYE